ncbi:hypothetical protein ANCDUO_03425 [Ancylostoma duodenale]|uniref:Uncharacterized protein n=1 Tax=Ancylostoma duodenale TaxID=51022 RepID=A0A0C2D932_9BILA|nr:hypothetical protein ANCDUO_03425 [Ancylostoma duodenale]
MQGLVFRSTAKTLQILAQCPRKSYVNRYIPSIGEIILLIGVDFVKKSDYRVGGLPVVRLTFRGDQSLTALVQRWLLRCITCPAHLILLNLS